MSRIAGIMCFCILTGSMAAFADEEQKAMRPELKTAPSEQPKTEPEKTVPAKAEPTKGELKVIGTLNKNPAPAGCPTEKPSAQKARALYEEALINEATGNLGAAREMYERLVKQYAPSQFACWAEIRLHDLKEGKARINKEGRAQFIVGTTMFGAWSGFSLATIATSGDDDLSESDAKGTLWAAIGGAAAGLIPSILLSSDLPMSTGRATLINFGWAWGLWHGMAFSLMQAPDLETQAMFGLALGMSAAGWAATFAITNYVDVADGDAALVAAGGYWFTWFTGGFGVLISDDFFDDEEVFIPILLIGGDLGVAATSLLSPRLDMSAGRVGLINLGGFLGALLGAGILVLAEPENYRTAVGLELAFSIGGLAGAYFLTRGYDEPGTPATGLAAVEWTREGWTVGAPIPRLSPAWVDGQRTLTVEFPILGGSF